MATIATLTVKQDGSLEGTLATLNVTAPIAVLPNTRKTKDSEPDFRIISRKNGFELGAGWNRISKNTGEEYVSVSLSAPEFGTIYGNVAPAPGDDRSKKVIIWNSPNCSPQPWLRPPGGAGPSRPAKGAPPCPSILPRTTPGISPRP